MPSADGQKILRAIEALDVGRVNLMEVCGTHTMAIAKAGIRSMLPENIRLLSGPGCPVCVTPCESIDAILALAMRQDVIIATYGDMVRVPGSTPGDSLARRRALGAKVEVVYSPMDALEIAVRSPDREVVFLGVGFETTAPGTAVAAKVACERGIGNFSIWSMLKTVEPALRALIAMDDFNVQGFLCPGHVATVTGANGFGFLPEYYGIPAVVSGFEPEDILLSVYMLLRQIKDGEAKLENEYTRAVSDKGNTIAMGMISECFETFDDNWRGLGKIKSGGLRFREKYASVDAVKRFSDIDVPASKPTPCRCGDVITARISPQECPLFGKRCVPEDPVGPCMVSSEGACAAAYKYSFLF